jgi:mRNA interferase HigB
MVIISRSELHGFISHNPLAANSLNNWYEKTKNADWSNFHQVKDTFNTCDAIGNDRYVFDIGGNKFRLVAMIFFKKRTVYIRKILTHTTYDEYNSRGNLSQL